MFKRFATRRWVIRLGLAVAILGFIAFVFGPHAKPPDVCERETKQVVEWMKAVAKAIDEQIIPSPRDFPEVTVVAPDHPAVRMPVVTISTSSVMVDGQRVVNRPEGTTAPTSFPGLEEAMNEKRRNIAQSSSLLGGGSSDLAAALQIHRDARWQDVVSTLGGIQRARFNRVSFWFLQPRSLPEFYPSSFDDKVTGSLVSASNIRYGLVFLTPLKYVSSSYSLMLESMEWKHYPGSVCGLSGGTMGADEFIERTSALMKERQCAVDVESLKTFMWKRFGPGFWDYMLEWHVGYPDDTPETVKFRKEHRYFIGATANITSTSDARVLAFDANAPWSSVAQPLVDELNRLGDVPVRLAIK